MSTSSLCQIKSLQCWHVCKQVSTIVAYGGKRVNKNQTNIFADYQPKNSFIKIKTFFRNNIVMYLSHASHWFFPQLQEHDLEERLWEVQQEAEHEYPFKMEEALASPSVYKMHPRWLSAHTALLHLAKSKCLNEYAGCGHCDSMVWYWERRGLKRVWTLWLLHWSGVRVLKWFGHVESAI